MSEPLDHHGPLEGMCFLGLNFTPEQFDAIGGEIVAHMDDQSGCEFAAESGIVAIVTRATRQKAIIDGLVAEVAAVTKERDELRRLLAAWFHNAAPQDSYDPAAVMDPDHLEALTAAALQPGDDA